MDEWASSLLLLKLFWLGCVPALRHGPSVAEDLPPNALTDDSCTTPSRCQVVSRLAITVEFLLHVFNGEHGDVIGAHQVHD